MSLYFETQSATIAQNGTSTSEIDLKATCDLVRLELGAMDSCTVSMTGALASGGTFRNIGVSGRSTATTTGNCFLELKVCGLQFIKVVASASQTTADVTIKATGIKF